MYQGQTLTEISAHSPLYSVKMGRVASKNAGAANIAVAIPAFMANLIFRSLNAPPIAQILCLTRPTKVKSDLAGV